MDGISRRASRLCRRENIFFLLAAIFQNIAPFTAAAVWSQITTGLLGLVVQAVLVPFLILGIRYLADRDKNHD